MEKQLKPNELRIGNYVDLYGSVAQIERSDFAKCKCIHGIAVDSGRPIPLTEEWLIKFGFKLEGSYYNLLDNASQNVFQLPIFPQQDGSIEIMCRVSDTYLLELETVHQLQNLYFSLTGSELKL